MWVCGGWRVAAGRSPGRGSRLWNGACRGALCKGGMTWCVGGGLQCRYAEWVACSCRGWCREQPQCREHLLAAAMCHGKWPWGLAWSEWGEGWLHAADGRVMGSGHGGGNTHWLHNMVCAEGAWHAAAGCRTGSRCEGHALPYSRVLELAGNPTAPALASALHPAAAHHAPLSSMPHGHVLQPAGAACAPPCWLPT